MDLYTIWADKQGDITDLELGRRSLEHECAYYKQLGYEYLYLGQVAEYKTHFDGYEQLGKLNV